MTSRRYPDKLTFQQRNTTTAASGQVLEQFVTVFSRFGKVTQTGGGEAVRDDQLRTSSAYTVELPRDLAAAAVQPDWRILWRDQFNTETILNLTSVNVSESGRTAKLFFTATR